MRKTVGGLVAIAGVILWASVMAQQNAPARSRSARPPGMGVHAAGARCAASAVGPAG